MPTPSIPSRAAARGAWLALLLAVAACGGDAPVAPTPSPPSLQAGTYVLVRADGQPLPAMVAHETLPDGSLLQTFADSAQLVVSADAAWEQRLWLRVVRYGDGALLGRPNVVDRGRWAGEAGQAFLLTPDYQAWRPALRVTREADGSLTTWEKFDSEQAGLMHGTYRRR